ncbi:MAG: dolichyl-diphosphooligosaccharide--protein glycosyltransferase subunit STT3 [Proteobacteria bacterium]|nr:dolichyl-diphosphooligosaccharide--protein glycosyltransferase subunit STT3 [Pseudomonadota bacterium]
MGGIKEREGERERERGCKKGREIRERVGERRFSELVLTDVTFLLQAFGVFGLCQIHAFIDYLRSKLSQSHFEILFRTLAITVTVAAIVVGGALTFLGSIHLLHMQIKKCSIE